MLQSDKRNRDDDAGQYLISELRARSEPQIAAMHYFEVIVRETNRTESQRGEYRDPDERVAQVGPQQRRH